MTSQPPSTPPRFAPVTGATPADLDRAASIILAGGLVAIPTETVYGLAADATSGEAVARIYEAKGRPEFNPLICHVSSMEMAASIATFNATSKRLADTFWPGPLTLVMQRTAHCPVNQLATAGLDTIAVRFPKNPATSGIIERVGRPLAAPSANPSMHLSPTTASHVAAAMGDRIDLIIDGGACPAGIESTIVAVTDSGCLLLRPGAIARAEIEAITGPLITPEAGSKTIAPGMLARHYAPRAALRLAALDHAPNEAFLAFGSPPEGVAPSLNLSLSGDLAEAAANLFSMLHELDSRYARIAIAPVPDFGLGEGINDRLKRAAASFREDGV